MIPFLKMHGTGNDFVVIPDLENALEITPEQVRALCDRHFGIGADGVIRIAPGQNAPFFMDYRNEDGSLAEMCGNGIRVVGKWLGDNGHAGDSVDVETRSGVKNLLLRRVNDSVETVVVDMGVPVFPEAITSDVVVGDQKYTYSFVSMGNPHAVIVVADVDAVDLDVVGRAVQSQSDLFPEGVNVEVAAIRPENVIDERTFERGVGETLACGTGACAVAVAAQRQGLVGEQVKMNVRGGELILEWQPGGSVFMTGPATLVFTGELTLA